MRRAVSVPLSVCLAVTWLMGTSASAGAAETATMSGGSANLGPRSVHLVAGTYSWSWSLVGSKAGKYGSRTITLATDTYTWKCSLPGITASNDRQPNCELTGAKASHFATLPFAGSPDRYATNLSHARTWTWSSQLDPQF